MNNLNNGARAIIGLLLILLLGGYVVSRNPVLVFIIGCVLSFAAGAGLGIYLCEND